MHLIQYGEGRFVELSNIISISLDSHDNSLGFIAIGELRYLVHVGFELSFLSQVQKINGGVNIEESIGGAFKK